MDDAVRDYFHRNKSEAEREFEKLTLALWVPIKASLEKCAVGDHVQGSCVVDVLSLHVYNESANKLLSQMIDEYEFICEDVFKVDLNQHPDVIIKSLSDQCAKFAKNKYEIYVDMDGLDE